MEFENNNLVIIRDLHPQAPHHLLVIPRRHIAQIKDVTADDFSLLGEMIVCAKETARRLGFEDGFRLVFNNGEKAGQSVFHIHLHVLGGRAMTWPPG